MKFGINYEQGDVVLVPFPFAYLSTVKKRPVLVLSKTPENELSEDLITCAITSKHRSSHHNLIIDNSNIDKGSLPVQSTILISKLFTIEKTLILSQIARLDQETLENVKELFCDLI